MEGCAGTGARLGHTGPRAHRQRGSRAARRRQRPADADHDEGHDDVMHDPHEDDDDFAEWEKELEELVPVPA